MDKVDVRFPDAEQRPPPNIPRTASERADALLRLMDRLIGHLRRETQLVGSRQSSRELEKLAAEKGPMTLVYDELSRLLRLDRDGLRNLPGEVKEKLRDDTLTLHHALSENIEALRKRNASQQNLVDVAIDAVNRARKVTTVSYAPRIPAAPHGVAGRSPRHGPATSGTLNTHL